MTAAGYLGTGALFAGRFEIGRELGRGGFSVVYAARDRQVGHEVALKLLVPSPATAQSARERMRREVHAVRQLAHPNIVAVYDFVEDGPYSAVIMELVDGEDLDARVRRRGPLPSDALSRLGDEIAAGLGAAHARGILHRDVKPQNILLERGGRARLTDFGSARMEGEATITRTGAIVGTLAYMSPEVVAGRRGDARSDVFALGMTLFYAAAGRLPDRPSPHLPPPPSAAGFNPLAVGAEAAPWLSRVIARATSAEPGDRFPTPAALADAIARRDPGSAADSGGVTGIERCVLCGGPDPLAMAVCFTCAGEGDRADTYIFLGRPRSRVERERALESAAGLVGMDAEPATLVSVARGERALMKVPSAVAPRVTDMLAARGLSAAAVADRELWKALPPNFLTLAGAVVFAGLLAGSVGDRMLMVSSVPIALALLLGGTISLGRPALVEERRGSALSDAARRRVAETFASLTPGPARALLADVVRRSQAVQRSLRYHGDASGLPDTVDELLTAACGTSIDLAALDDSLTLFERERRDAHDARWIDGLAECERARDVTVQRLLDAVTVLGRLETQVARGDGEAAALLSEVVREMEGEVRVREAARTELAALLRG